MFLFKSCPRCHGDLNITLERELVCLQCGHEVPREAAKAMIAEYTAAHRARRPSLPVAA
jgi:exosome complex RNA-binding protein Csl4